MTEQVYLAVDLGASGGRVFAGRFDGTRLTLDELHRFEHGGIFAGGTLFWDLLGLWREINVGLRIAAARYGRAIRSVGVDTWGVDFALLGRGDTLLGNPVCYRDRRTTGVMERTFDRVPRAEIFRATGLQFMGINTLYQLLALQEQRSPWLDAAESFLMMPDLFHWLLSGAKAVEATNASTTQMFDPVRRTWAVELLERLGLPTHIFGPVIAPGTRLGRLRADVAEATGLVDVDVVAPGTHDTASAVVAVPAAGGPAAMRPDWCYISSGTWSLMGVETAEPVLTDKCLGWNFTNEGGVGGTVRLLKNITGLWLVQECRRVWSAAGDQQTWETLAAAAAQARPLQSLIDPDAAEFQVPGDMPAAIRAFCRSTGQPEPVDHGAVIRCCLESLALRYRYVHGALEDLTGGPINTIHIVGGGTQNKFLSQAAADASGRRVVAGPVEATVLGNVIVQAITAGTIGSIAEGRDVVRRSFPVDEFQPRNTADWDAALTRFEALRR